MDNDSLEGAFEHAQRLVSSIPVEKRHQICQDANSDISALIAAITALVIEFAASTLPVANNVPFPVKLKLIVETAYALGFMAGAEEGRMDLSTFDDAFKDTL